MPFGCVPIRQDSWSAAHCNAERLVSNAFRLCAYPAAASARSGTTGSRGVSNAFRLCAYPADTLTTPGRWVSVGVSNAFRLCAYPAGQLKRRRYCPRYTSPMPFGCVPIRQSGTSNSSRRRRNPVSNAFRLCAYPAASSGLPGSTSRLPVSNAFRLCAYPAVCIVWPEPENNRRVSNAFRLCAYPADPLRVADAARTVGGLQCLSAVCLSGSCPEGGFPLIAECLQCLSAVCLSGRGNDREMLVGASQVSPMPFGCVPIRQVGARSRRGSG